MNAPGAPDCEGANTPLKPIPVTLGLLVFFRVFFVATYPLNIAGDGTQYHWMILNWKSHLLHASGYPFFFNFPRMLFECIGLTDGDSALFRYLLLVTQHVVDTGVLVLLFFTLIRVFGVSTAAIACLLYGLNPYILSVVSSCRPEWFQADLFTAGLCIAFFAYASQRFKTKLALYVLSGLVFTLGYFTKFNLLPLCLALVLVVFADAVRGKSKVVILACMAVGSMIFRWGYVTFYHFPSTGTRHLTYDRSWILIEKATRFASNPKLDVDNGISTKRYKLLTISISNRFRWQPENPAEFFRHVDALSPEKRQPFRERFLPILSAEEPELDRMIQEIPQAAQFLGNPLLISQYIGLEESDTLGTKVFLEAVRAEPGVYLAHVLSEAWESLFVVKKNSFPVNKRLGWKVLGSPRAFDPQRHIKEKLPFAYVEVDLRKSRGMVFDPPIFLMPGVQVFSVLGHVFKYWVQAALFSLLIVAAGCAIGRIRNKRWTQRSLIAVMMAFMVAGFIVFSCAIYEFRPVKELNVIAPFLCIFLALLIERSALFFRPKNG